MSVPDPNYFGGEIQIATATEDWQKVPTEHGYAEDNYRIIGVADMAHAIRTGRPHRASGELAFHVLEVMEAVQRSSDDRHTRRDHVAAGAPGHAADDPEDRRLRLGHRSRHELGFRERNHARGTDRLGRMERARARKGRPRSSAHARGGRLQGPRREHDARPSPIRRSPT